MIFVNDFAREEIFAWCLCAGQNTERMENSQ